VKRLDPVTSTSAADLVTLPEIVAMESASNPHIFKNKANRIESGVDVALTRCHPANRKEGTCK